MSLGQTAWAPASAWLTAVLREQLERDVVHDLVAVDDAAVAVRRVLAEADVGEEHELGRTLRERTERLLDDAVLVVGARRRLVLLLRDPEEEDGADAEPQELLGLVGEPVDRALRDAGQAFERLRRLRRRDRRRAG